jgi:hypothetical protein
VDFEDVFWQTADRQYCWLPTRRKFKMVGFTSLYQKQVMKFYVKKLHMDVNI